MIKRGNRAKPFEKKIKKLIKDAWRYYGTTEVVPDTSDIWNDVLFALNYEHYPVDKETEDLVWRLVSGEKK